ncbi:MAG: FAD-binding oxidoreductase [Cyanobacteria bacterium P01_F01_bin.116]
MTKSSKHLSTSPMSDSLWGHKWGFTDTRLKINSDRSVTMTGHRYPLAGYKMPYLLPHIEASFAIKIDADDCLHPVEYPNLPAPKQHPEFCQAITDQFSANQYSFETGARLLHSHGQTTFEEVYQVLYGTLERFVDMVFYCESTTDAQRLIELAITHNICLIPFGGGTSVSCALKLPPGETRMIVSVDMKRMNQIEWIDTHNLRACVQAGITGKQLETELRKKGFTCGHEPDSLELSTLGGWIATNASGMKKNRYGNIEQIVEKITLLTPAGVLEQIHPITRVSMGMQLQSLLFGNEGNLGLITSAVIKIHPVPDVTSYGSLIFPNFEQGSQFLYALTHSGVIPASIRLVDNHQFRFGQALKPGVSGWQAYLEKLKKFYVLKLRGFDSQKMVAATIVMEGTATEVAWQQKHINRLAKQYQGLATGAENGRRGYMLTYAIAYLRDFLTAHYILGETFETSVPWSKIQQVCSGVEQQLQDLHRKFDLPGQPYLSYRISQVYHTGVCVYFTFGIYVKGVETPAAICSQIERALRQTIIDNGGSISHHHGVGKIRQDFMKDTLSGASIKLLRQLKQASDPQNIFGICNNIFTKN